MWFGVRLHIKERSVEGNKHSQHFKPVFACMVNAFKVFSRYIHNTTLLTIFILLGHRPLEHIASLTLTRYPTSPSPSLINLFLYGFSFHLLWVCLPPQCCAIYWCSFHSSNSNTPMATGMSSEWAWPSSAQICMFWAPGGTVLPQPPKYWMVHASVLSKAWDLTVVPEDWPVRAMPLLFSRNIIQEMISRCY